MKNNSLPRKIAIFILIIDALILVSFMFDLGFLYKLSKSVIENVDFPLSLAKWLEILLLLITGGSQVPLFFKSKRNKIIAIVITALSFVIYFATAYFYTNGYHYNFDGKVNWYILTPSCEIKFFDSPGLDHEYGFSYKKVDSNVIIAHKWSKGERADNLGRACETALILAARGGHDEVVRCLLLNRANTKLKDNSGLAALDHAIQNKKAQVIDILRRYPR